MSRLRLFGLILLAGLAGIVCSELLCRSYSVRDTAGRLLGRGPLIALTNGRGFYQNDLENPEVSTASDLIATENLHRMTKDKPIEPATVDYSVSRVQAQFGDEASFLRGLLASGLSISSLGDRISEQLRSLQWLEREIRAQALPTEAECRNFYGRNRASFVIPARFRVSHVFLAAPAGTEPEVVESKRLQTEALYARLVRGESLAQLATEASEDEATKKRAGDLGFFSTARIAAALFTEIEKLAVSQDRKPFRSSLGFHLAEVTEILPARALSFEEVRGEIVVALANQRRALIVRRVADMLIPAGDGYKPPTDFVCQFAPEKTLE